jgi:hypothetical protein
VESNEFKLEPSYADGGSNPSGLAIEVRDHGSNEDILSTGAVCISAAELQKVVDYALQKGLIRLPGAEDLTAAFRSLATCMEKLHIPGV